MTVVTSSFVTVFVCPSTVIVKVRVMVTGVGAALLSPERLSVAVGLEGESDLVDDSVDEGESGLPDDSVAEGEAASALEDGAESEALSEGAALPLGGLAEGVSLVGSVESDVPSSVEVEVDDGVPLVEGAGASPEVGSALGSWVASVLPEVESPVDLALSVAGSAEVGVDWDGSAGVVSSVAEAAGSAELAEPEVAESAEGSS